MKKWRSLRNDIVAIFPADVVTYKKKDEAFEICGSSFVQEEMKLLNELCMEKGFWFYINAIDYDEIMITVK